MKRIVFLLMLWVGIVLAQYVAEYHTAYLFENSGYVLEERPTFSVNAPNYKFLRTTGAADTVTSRDFLIEKGGGDVVIYMRRDPISGNTVSARVEMLIWRAPGFPDSTGYEIKSLATFNGAGTARVALADSSWWASEPVNRFKIRIVETGNTENYWMVQLKHYKLAY